MKPRRRLKSARAQRSGAWRAGGEPDRRRPSRWAASARRWMLSGHGCLMRILVTGGAGYIGSHTCKAFAAKGFETIV
jgi:hypothetical protein